ncbi:uncharacterized protein [Montipora foliosa]|uniref:uncharacterized protein isoform X1 n=1 Tax=Montipora foliosa TaxID=591990 RepID=UPI0035F15069
MTPIVGWLSFLCLIHNSMVKGEDHSLDDGTSRHPSSFCHFLCTQRTNPLEKESSFDLCSKACFHPKTGGEISKPLSKERTRRANKGKENEELEKCLTPPFNPSFWGSQMPERILVDFKSRKPNLTVKWSSAEHELYPNWTSYALAYQDSFLKKYRCVLIPKDKHQWIIRDGDDWTYPNMIFLGVATYPYHELEMKPYAPIPDLPTRPPTPVPGPTKVIVAVIGVGAGILLLLILLLVYRKRFNWFSSCSSGPSNKDVVGKSVINNSCVDRGDPNDTDVMYPKIVNHLPMKSNDPEFFYACYYPENEDFTRAVASIVNYFRQNGYPVEMDVMSSNEMVNLGPTRWAELKIKKASKILVFLSPGILRMCGVADEESQSSHQEHERIWYEMCLLRTIYSQTHSAAKMVCITQPRRMTIDPRDVPLWAEMRYRWPEDKRKILNRLNDRPFILPL